MSDKNETTEIITLLGSIMALSREQRVALFGAWQAIDDLPIESKQEKGEADEAAKTEPKAEAPPPANDGVTTVEDVNEWIKEKRLLDPRSQVEALREAIKNEEEPWIVSMLETELSRVKNKHLGLTVEIALVDYAYEKPLMTVAALALVVFTIYRLGKGLFHMVF
jgi:hypothetical protein